MTRLAWISSHWRLDPTRIGALMIERLQLGYKPRYPTEVGVRSKRLLWSHAQHSSTKLAGVDGLITASWRGPRILAENSEVEEALNQIGLQFESEVFEDVTSCFLERSPVKGSEQIKQHLGKLNRIVRTVGDQADRFASRLCDLNRSEFRRFRQNTG